MKDKGLTKKKVLIVLSLIAVVLVSTLVILIILKMEKKADNKPEETQIDNPVKEQNNIELVLKKELSFEINGEVKVSDLLDASNTLIVKNKDEAINTSKLGEYEVTIKYKDNDEEKEQIVKISIIDAIPPTIEYKKELSTTEGTTIDLLSGVKVTDNSKEEIKATVEGTYDFNKVGTYKLKYVAVDSSNNKVEEEFTLKVNKKVVNSIKVGSGTLYFGKYKMEGDFPSEYTGTITINADGTATSTGYYYSSNGQFVKKNLTGKWSFEENSIAGLAGAPDDMSKVNGIHFSWSNGEKFGYGLSTKYFGDQFHGYRWYSY